jgi:putative SOS response-associated peptidase YedK
MCYNVKALLRSQLLRARRAMNQQAIEEIQERLNELGVNDLHQVSGFSHPKLIIYIEPNSEPVVATWGLVPNWVKNEEGKVQIWNSTLNARGETIFEKASFRDSAKFKRCLVYLDGFYEHHHYAGKTYPFFISRKDGEPFPVAGLWAEWTDKVTQSKLISFSIVTTQGNEMMTRIHNNPKLEGSRMPVILPEELADRWLDNRMSQQELTQLLLPFDDELLTARTVARISGKESKGNVPEATDEYHYEEIKIE